MSLWFIIPLKLWYAGKRADPNPLQATLIFHSPKYTIKHYKIGQIKYRDKGDTLEAAPSDSVKLNVELKFEFFSL